MDAGGNKLSSCKIADQYLKNQNSYITFRTLATLAKGSCANNNRGVE